MTDPNLTIKSILKASKDRSFSARRLIKTVWRFAKTAHEGQKRLSGEPYLIHPAFVACSLAEIGLDKNTIAAGLLHDILEDTETTEKTLEENFGKEITALVKGVTKLGALKYRGKEQQIENLRNLFVATAQDARVITIKLFDRLHNLETLEYHNKERRKRKALETLEIYAPIADRLGMGVLKTQLEDLAFLNLYPKEYKDTAKLEKDIMEETKKSVKDTLDSIKNELKKNKINFKVEIGRKGIYSLYKKLKRKSGNLESIYDISPIKIIVKDISHCYQVMGIIHAKFLPLPEHIKDFISFPKPNGYRGLHTSIFTGQGDIIEVQIRTEEMDRRAKIGIIYDFASGTKSSIFKIPYSFISLFNLFKAIGKNYQNISKPLKEIPVWFKEMIAGQKDFKNPDQFLDNLSKDFFNHRILVFTPKGDTVDLPIDSTPIDFAYCIHSDLGNHLNEVKIDGIRAPINTKLKNGNIVEIITSPLVSPSRNWLNYVKTVLAKQQIHHFLQRKIKHSQSQSS